MLHGVVTSRDDGAPLPYASVRVLGTDRVAETDPRGVFLLRDLPPGTHRIGVSIVGYRPALDSLTIAPSDSIRTIRFSLETVAFALNEVVVRAAPPGPESHAQSLSTEEIRRLPATADDLFRAVQVLPGLATSDFTASFLLRGGESDETLIRLDEIDLLEPFHVRGWGGAISVVSLDAVSGARLQRGGLPARYGRQLSGALEIESPPERPERRVSSIGAGMTHVRAMTTGPMKNGGSYLVAARHGLVAALNRAYQLDPDTRVEPDFQDVLAEARFRAGARGSLLLMALAARDQLEYDESWDESDVDGLDRNVTVGGVWTARPSDRLHHRSVVSADLLHRRQRIGHTGHDDDLTRAVRGRAEGEFAIAPAHSLEAGVAGEWEDARLRFEDIDASMMDGAYAEKTVAVTEGSAIRRRAEAFASLHSRLGARISTTVGVNVAADAYQWAIQRNGATPLTNDGSASASPRLSAAARLSERLLLRAAAGVLRQPAFLNLLNSERLAVSLGRGRTAREAILGVDVRIPAGGLIRIDAYTRRDRGVSFPLQDLAARPELTDPLDRGRARGVEIYAKLPASRRADASLGYTLSKATWETPLGLVPRSFDQRHSFNVSVNVRPAGAWNVNATARYHTGTAYTRIDWTSPDGRFEWTKSYGPFMGARYPDYFRLDIRMTHPLRWGLPGSQFYVELINATGHENVLVYTHGFDPLPFGGWTPRRFTIDLLPRIPSAGFEVRF